MKADDKMSDYCYMVIRENGAVEIPSCAYGKELTAHGDPLRGLMQLELGTYKCNQSDPYKIGHGYEKILFAVDGQMGPNTPLNAKATQLFGRKIHGSVFLCTGLEIGMGKGCYPMLRSTAEKVVELMENGGMAFRYDDMVKEPQELKPEEEEGRSVIHCAHCGKVITAPTERNSYGDLVWRGYCNEYFCSPDCERSCMWAYIVLKCDGSTELVKCRAPEFGGYRQDEHLDIDYYKWEFCKHDFPIEKYSEKYYQVLWDGSIALRTGSILEKKGWGWVATIGQLSFDPESLNRYANKAIWKLLRKVCLGDVIGGSNRRQWFSPMPLRKAEKMLRTINARMASVEDVPIPLPLLQEKYVPSNYGPFFERHYRNGSLFPFNLVLQFERDDDFRWFAENCNYSWEREEEDENEVMQTVRTWSWGIIDSTDKDTLIQIGCYSYCDFPTIPINDACAPFWHGCCALGSRKLDEWVRSGRVKVFCALRFKTAEAFLDFQRKEHATEGVAWKTVFQNLSNGGIADGYEKEHGNEMCWEGFFYSWSAESHLDWLRERKANCVDGHFKNLDAAVVALALPLSWVDKSPWHEVKVCGHFD